jgi:homocysteine S-methyltransferase
MDRIRERFRAGLVLDGGLATELERAGEDLDDPLWSARVLVERPERVLDVHASYLAAGAEVVTTASYQASFEGFAARGLAPAAARRVFEASVRLARDAYDRAALARQAGDLERPLVAASLGSYGAFLADGSEFTGAFGKSVRELAEWHRPRFEVMAASGADVLAFETIPCLREAEAIARLLEDAGGVTLAWVSFSARDEAHVASGEPFEACVRALAGAPGLVGVGVNCTAPRFVKGLLDAASAACPDVPRIVYPNAGERWDAARRAWADTGEGTRFDPAASVPAWWNAGARAIGGCCRTTPATVSAIASALDALRAR